MESRYTRNGIHYFRKAGSSTEITTSTDPEDVCEQGGIYIFPSYTISNSGVITDKLVDTIVSSSAEDITLKPSGDPGTGAITIAIEGVDIDYNNIKETVNLMGTTAVTLRYRYLRINEFYVTKTHTDVNGVGFSANIGVIKAYNAAELAGGDTVNYALITVVSNYDSTSVYTVEDDLYINKIIISQLSEDVLYDIALFAGKKTIMEIKWRSYIEKPAGVTEKIEHEFSTPIKIDKWSDMKIMVLSVSATATQITTYVEGTFDKDSRGKHINIQ
jgi:hypothetical protein